MYDCSRLLLYCRTRGLVYRRIRRGRRGRVRRRHISGHDRHSFPSRLLEPWILSLLLSLPSWDLMQFSGRAPSGRKLLVEPGVAWVAASCTSTAVRWHRNLERHAAPSLSSGLQPDCILDPVSDLVLDLHLHNFTHHLNFHLHLDLNAQHAGLSPSAQTADPPSARGK